MAPPPAVSGPMASTGFRLLDDGASVGDLVMSLEITPAEALALESRWAACRLRSGKADKLLEVLALNEELIEAGWSCGQVRTAFAQVARGRELLAGTGWTGDAALELLRTASERFATFEDAGEALEALLGVEDLQEQAEAAQEVCATARAHLLRLRQELAGYGPFLALGGAAAAFAEFVRSGGEGASALRKVTEALPQDLLDTWETISDRAGPEVAASARVELAETAAQELGDLLMLRSEHTTAVRAARETDRMGYIALGMMSARAR